MAKKPEQMAHASHPFDLIGTMNADCPDCQAIIRANAKVTLEYLLRLIKEEDRRR